MRSPWVPCAVLAALLAVCLINSAWLTGRCGQWNNQLKDIDQCAAAENWDGARLQLRTLYGQWQALQPWLHITLAHDALSEAEALFCRAAVLAAEEDSVEFRAHIADLRSQLMLLAEMEQPRAENIF